MELSELEQQKTRSLCHVLAVPYPGRGHVNPMMNLCNLLLSNQKDHNLFITFVVTEEWLGIIAYHNTKFISNYQIHFRTIPNVLPSELVRGNDFPGFYEAVMTKMEAPFEQLLDQIEPPVSLVMADTELLWAVPAANRRNIPVASLWTTSASMFSMFSHFDLIQARCFQEGSDDKQSEHVPGLSTGHVADLQTVIQKTDKRVLKLALECISKASKAQYLLLTSFYEFEPRAMDSLRTQFPFPVYPIGPAIPYLELDQHNSSSSTSREEHDYFQWLNSQPSGSVLYISLGSFLSVSNAQMDEIAYGLCDSGVGFLWVARSEASRLKEICGDLGLVVPWCDQLKVLCHSSVGGFWTHCGWNSLLEAVFGGVPMLTFPLFLDQFPNSRQIVEDWKIGWRVERDTGNENLMKREEITKLVKRFMDHESSEGKEMRKRARELRDVCQRAIAKGGSSDENLDAFIRNICNTRPVSQ